MSCDEEFIMENGEWRDGVVWNECVCGCNQVIGEREFRNEVE